jgi:hypothetical protein
VRLSCNREGCAAAVVGTNIYIMGGTDGWSRLSKLSSRMCVSTIDIWDTTTNAVRKGPSMTTAWEGCAGGNPTYIVRGQDPNCGGEESNWEKKYDTIEYLDVMTTDLGKWRKCNATMSTARSCPAVAVVQHCLVIMGGQVKSSNVVRRRKLSSVEVFDTQRDVFWRYQIWNKCDIDALQWLWKSRKFLVVGGNDVELNPLQSMEAINLNPSYSSANKYGSGGDHDTREARSYCFFRVHKLLREKYHKKKWSDPQSRVTSRAAITFEVRTTERSLTFIHLLLYGQRPT